MSSALAALYANGIAMIRRELRDDDAPYTPPTPPAALLPARTALPAGGSTTLPDDPANAFIDLRAWDGEGAAFAVKDNIDVAGFPTTCGTYGTPPVEARDAAVVAELRAAGGVCVGKTNLGEIALEATTDNPHFGRTLNPVDHDRTPGGSSGGSAAAVASGQVAFALGTDSGGSVRIPAAACGIVGYRPSWGSVSLDGLRAPAWTLDSIGVLARSVADAASALQAISLRAAPPRDLSRARVGYLDDASMGRCQPQVWAVYRESIDRLRDAGTRLVPLSLRGLTLAPYVCAITAYVEVAAQIGDRVTDERLGAAVRPLLELGLAFTGVDYVDAQRMRARISAAYADASAGLDAVLTPTLPCTAPRWGEAIDIEGDDPEIALFALIRFTCLANLNGAPAVSIPAGVAVDGLPVGLQLMGHSFDDLALLELAARVEAGVAARSAA